VRVEYLDGPAAGTVQDTSWSAALPSLYWAAGDGDATGVVYVRTGECADAVTNRWTYRVHGPQTPLVAST
jgi:hypothetical protein